VADEKQMTPQNTNGSGRRIRVSIVVSRLFPVTGLESVTISLVEAIACTYDVRVIVLADEASTVVQHPLVTVASWGGKVVGWKRILTILRAFRHRRGLEDSVIILSGAWAAIPMLLALPKRSRMRTLVWEHSLDNHQINIKKRLKLLRAVARPLYARARATIAVSESLRRDMYDAGFGGTIEMIPNIVRKFDSDHVNEVVPGRLLTVGSLSTVKNQSLALRTLALLPSHYSLDVLGDGPERSNLLRLAVELGIADRVNFHGYVAYPAEYFAQAQFVIHPSHSETYGLVMYEAADFNKPVIAANQGVMADVIPRLVPGAVAEPNPHAFASAILSLDADPVSEADFAEAARRRELASKNIVRDWSRLISRAAGE
jgi:glycosyltransferase involved in cell wall biosynthesis